MIGRPPRRRRFDPIKAQLGNIQCIDEGIDHANRIALVNPVIEAFRQQRRLRPIRPLQRSASSIPPQNHQENLSNTCVFTQPGSSFPVPVGSFDRYDNGRSTLNNGQPWQT